ncbi:MAG: hypothetical protein JOZ70_03640 [Pseudolabrys sp.]|nr:hypothetical protein [Pseudolabrys sp.]
MSVWRAPKLFQVAALAFFAALFVAPPAKAGPLEDLDACLHTFQAGMKAAGAIADAAEEVVKATSDPNFLACVAEASSGNPITIAAMGAMTAYWATNPDAFTNPETCQTAIYGEILQGVAGALTTGIDALGDLGDVAWQILGGIIGSDGVQMIKDLATGTAGGVAQSVIDQAVAGLKDILQASPLGHYLSCGCAAAGTAAVIKTAAEAVAAAGGEAAKSLSACWDALSNPGALLEAVWNDPGAALKLVGGALCDAAAEIVDVCGAAAALYEGAKAIVDEACKYAGGACETLSAAYDTVKCWFSDCDSPTYPSKAPPAPCDIGVAVLVGYGSGSLVNYSCVCSPPNGKKSSYEQAYGSLGWNTYLAYTCDRCGQYEGVNDKTGMCEKCPVGFQQTNAPGDQYDGKCTSYYTCGPGERYTKDNTGCYSCPAGMTFNDDNSGCKMDCSATPWLVFDPNWGSAGRCTCPPGPNGAIQISVGDHCEVQKDCNLGAGEALDPATNTCYKQCTDPHEYFDSAGYDPSFWRCKPCGDGKIALDNKCVAECKMGEEIRSPDLQSCVPCSGPDHYVENGQCKLLCGANEIDGGGSCMACPHGTTKQGNSCSNACPAGTAVEDKEAPSLGALLTAVTEMTKADNITMKAAPTAQSLPLAATQAAADNVGQKKKNWGFAPPKKQPADYCTPCAENEMTLTTTVMGPGYSIEKTVCVQCPDGMKSKPGSAQCHKEFDFGLVAALPNPTRPPGKPATGIRPGSGPLTGTEVLPKQPGLTGTEVLPQQPGRRAPPPPLTGTPMRPNAPPPLTATPVLPSAPPPPRLAPAPPPPAPPPMRPGGGFQGKPF